MHRYSAASGGSGTGNNTTGVPRDTARPDSSYSSASSFSHLSRRSAQLVPYKLRCERESLSARLGQPDFYPPAPNCPEELLSREACQNGYKETIEGIEESKETLLTLAGPNSSSIFSAAHIVKYKESIRKRLRALQNALGRKQKAGQVYGVPLSGPLLTKPGHFPEQRPCREDHRKKWIEDLAQPKRLRLLAENVPHGLRKRNLFEALIKNEVPYLRATWFIKIMHLNQVRPSSIAIPTGGQDKSHEKRIDSWTKDVLEYLESLLNEFCHHIAQTRLLRLGSSSQQIDTSIHGNLEGEESSLLAKWGYMFRLIQYHYAEGILHRVQVVEWVLKQLQERDAFEALELLLAMLLDLVDVVISSQAYVRVLVDISLHWLRKLCPSNELPDGSVHPQKRQIANLFIELLRYLLVSVPDTFVSFDCFPFPPYIYSNSHVSSKVSAPHFEEDSFLSSGCKASSNKTVPRRELAIMDLAESVQRRAGSLARAVSPGVLRSNEGKVIQNLEKTLTTGDVLGAYQSVFDEDFCSIEQIPHGWLDEIRSSLTFGSGFLRNIDLSELYAVRFLCEWATCEFRNCRNSGSIDRKVVFPRDVSRVYMAVSVLCLRLKDLENKKTAQGSKTVGCLPRSGPCLEGNKKRKEMAQDQSQTQIPSFMFVPSNSKNVPVDNYFQSPGPIHETIVAWLDQHELQKGKGFENLQLLLMELLAKNLFWPPAYVRQLLVTGLLEKKTTAADVQHAARHRCLLQHLPGPPGLDADVEGKSEANPEISEALRLYRNERHFALRGCSLYPGRAHALSESGQQLWNVTDSVDVQQKNSSNPCKIQEKKNRVQQKRLKVMQLKRAIIRCLCLPEWCIGIQVKPVTRTLAACQGCSKGQTLLEGNANDYRTDSTPGCEECCNKSKKQKSNEGGNSTFPQALDGTCFNDDYDDDWWMKTTPVLMGNVVKIEPQLPPPTTGKSQKLAAKGRQKTVRKLSLAQLAVARVEGSQGVTSMHLSDTKVHCPHHKATFEGGNLSQVKESKKTSFWTDMRSIGTAIRGLRFCDKRLFSRWLEAIIRQVVEGGGKKGPISTQMQNGAGAVGYASAEESQTRWRLGEDELAAALHFLDIAMDFPSIIHLLLWLLPKAAILMPAASGQSGRGIPIHSWNKDNFTVEVGEAAVLSGLRRYERIAAAMNLLPEVLSAAMKRLAMIMTSVPSGRAVCSSLMLFVHDLYKRYDAIVSVQMWEKAWKASTDQKMVAELDALKAGEFESNYGYLGTVNPGIGDDLDDQISVRLVGRLGRISSTMKDSVQRGLNEIIHQIVSRQKELCSSNGFMDIGLEKYGEGYQAAHRVVNGLLDCIKQTAGATAQGDLQIVAAAVSAVVNNAGSVAAIIFDTFAGSNLYGGQISIGLTLSLKWALQIHIHCIRLLKEAFGERHFRILEVAFAGEATSLVANALSHSSGRTSRPQFQLSPETPDPGSALTGELTGANVLMLGRSMTIAAAIAALVMHAILVGISSLERMVTLFKLKECIESMCLSKTSGVSSNGMSRTGAGNSFKQDTSADAPVFWFCALIGDCRTVASGLVSEILGEPSVLAFSRLQRLMPLTTVFPAAYSLFTVAVRRQARSYANRDDFLFHQIVCMAVNDLVSYEPFREVCLQDTCALYHHLSQDSNDYELAALLDAQGLDGHSKIMSLVPLRSRLFLHAILDGKLPTIANNEASLAVHGDLKGPNMTPSIQMEQLLRVLDELQPATFHWQWVELRLLLNELVLVEKLDGPNMSAEAAVRSANARVDKGQLAECEKTFTGVLLTRLLIRPDAAALYSEAVHLLGRSIEDFLILQVKWVLENSDMLLGRKSLRQQLEKIANRGGFKVGIGRAKVWSWLPPQEDSIMSMYNTHDRLKHGVSLEEGELAVQGVETWKECKERKNEATAGLCNDKLSVNKQFALERAFADLVLPCLARSVHETRTGFAFDLVKQLSNLEQQMSSSTRFYAKTSPLTSIGIEATTNKGFGLHKVGMESGSPGLGRRFIASISDILPLSAPALQISIWFRLQFLLSLLPLIHTDRDSTMRNMRQTLAPVLLRLLGSRIVQDAAEFTCPMDSVCSGQDSEWNSEAVSAAAAVQAGESLFERILSILHALLSRNWAVWLKPKPAGKGVAKAVREAPQFDREAAERMLADLEDMQLLPSVRVRIQAAISVFPPLPSLSICAGPPQVPATALSAFQNNVFGASNSSVLAPLAISQRHPFRIESSVGKSKTPPPQESEVETDPWLLLEDGTACNVVSGTSGPQISSENANLKACWWLKGAVRVRRTDLLYVGAVDDDT